MLFRVLCSKDGLVTWKCIPTQICRIQLAKNRWSGSKMITRTHREHLFFLVQTLIQWNCMPREADKWFSKWKTSFIPEVKSHFEWCISDGAWVVDQKAHLMRKNRELEDPVFHFNNSNIRSHTTKNRLQNETCWHKNPPIVSLHARTLGSGRSASLSHTESTWCRVDAKHASQFDLQLIRECKC